MTRRVVNPASLGRPSGYSNGVRAGPLLFIAGQVGSTGDADGRHAIVSRDFAAQFDQALANVLEVVRESGGTPASLVEITVFVTSVAQYRRARKRLAPIWRRRMGRHYPAITLVEVAGLFEPGAVLEIRGVAAVGRPR